ncbi:MAG: hypothetical protein ACI4OY_04825, partial [Aristaeellaceae bacterium]
MPDKLTRSLGSIVDDLWGTPIPRPAAAAKGDSAPAAPRASAPSFPPFEQLWKAVDETVDWTEVLAHDAPNDGLTAPEAWAQYRRYAAQVLAGDPEAYL